MSELQDILNLKIKANQAILQVISYEWRRVQGFTIKAAKSNEKNLYLWNLTTGLSKFDFIERKQIQIKEKIGFIALLKWFQNEMPERSILLLEDAHFYLESNSINERRETIAGFKSIAQNNTIQITQKNLIIYQAIRNLPIELEKLVYIIDLPLPTRNTLETVLQEVVNQLDFDEMQAPEEERIQVAESALGLTEFEAGQTFREIGLKYGRLTRREIKYIIPQKEQIIKKSGILEYFHPKEELSEVGGMDQLKEWFIQRKNGFDIEAQEFGLNAPKGVLLLGIPGCGKSLIAKAIASKWEKPLLKFDLGKVFGGVVGESEANIRKALDVANAIAPCILWIDEIEKGLSGTASSNQTDAGTSARVFGTLLTWMQEKEEPVFVVATANNIEQLPPELLRKGRFDEIFFVDLPGFISRQEIWEIHLKKRLKGRFLAKNFNLNHLAEVSAFYTGSEIEEAVNSSLYQAYSEDRDLKESDLIRMISKTYPLSKVMGEIVSDLRNWAKVRARLASEEPIEKFDVKEKIPKLRQEIKNPFA